MNMTAKNMVDKDRPLDDHGLASVTLSAAWSDDRASHEHQLHVERFSVWREADTLPREIAGAIPGMHQGERTAIERATSDIIDAWHPSRQITAKPGRFDSHYRRGLVVEPRLGRFYPQGFFHRIPGIFEEAVVPARITDLTGERMTVDLNHPMAGRSFGLELHVDHVLPGYDRRGGRCNNPLHELLQFTGLAAPLADGRPTDYGDKGHGIGRMDERADAAFYIKSRMVQHLDSLALGHINALYRRLIPAGSDVLDLMASFDSHLQGVDTANLHLLGMNREELAANRAGSIFKVQDLNLTPTLPYASDGLHAVVCTASIEYLTRPREVLAEILRTLRPGGLFIATFSNRWFPTKAIRIWSDLHEYERLGMVTQWLQQAGFGGLRTFSSSGWPRPIDDLHSDKTAVSDPVYAAWGYKN